MRLVLMLTVLSCGQEDVELAPRADGGGDGACGIPGSPRKCQGLGQRCTVAPECCSGHCAERVCLAAGSCGAPGAACTNRSDCCSGRCEPTRGLAGLSCLDYCLPIGAPCTRALDCCSLGCQGGVCSSDLCKETEEECIADADCCGDSCVAGRCALDTIATCRPTGESCTSGGNQPCCSGVCGQERCDFGPGPCRPPRALCRVDGDCCRGACSGSADSERYCVAVCSQSGGACSTSADCCQGLVCSGSPASCGGPESACRTLGESCQGDGDCCSALCESGFCGTTCAIP